MKTEKERILNHCFNRFITEGFRKISVETLSKELGISKKTIYKYFVSKEELIDATLEMAFKILKQNLNQIVQQNNNAVIKVRMVAEFILSFAVKVSDTWIKDLQSHGYNRWQRVEETRQKFIAENFGKIIEQGKEEGFIVDKPSSLILAILTSSIQGVVNPKFMMNNDISLNRAAEYTFDILFTGILTKKGRKIYKEYKAGNPNEIKF